MSETDSEIFELKRKLDNARKEIANLRQQMKKLSIIHNKDISSIKLILKEFKCSNCINLNKTPIELKDEVQRKSDETVISMKPIGYINTSFKDKKGVPRQPVVGGSIRSSLTINNDVFTNPEHSIEGLKDFSHLWILYHFHKNPPHFKAKVAPPRLDGERVGVFSCRSPHRPCPIGLSLVQIDEIENATIYFFGTDMVDGTPVLDIKPFIPQYDDPNSTNNNKSCFLECSDFYDEREAPDGEETTIDTPMPSTSERNCSTPVKVPNWILSNSKLKVVFSEQALQQLTDLNMEIGVITEVLSADPRSVYLRTNYGSQFYTFQIGESVVTSKFDDQNLTVTVLKIRKRENFDE